jgi:hypothetical protein
MIWGVIVVVLTLVAWLGQALTAFSPQTATKLGLTERESEVDPTFYADMRGEAIWDTVILWTLPLAGLLLVLGNAWWAYFGLLGGGMYLYFSGRGIVARLVLQRRGIAIGSPGSVRVGIVGLAIWGLIALVTMVMAVAALPLP